MLYIRPADEVGLGKTIEATTQSRSLMDWQPPTMEGDSLHRETTSRGRLDAPAQSFNFGCKTPRRQATAFIIN